MSPCTNDRASLLFLALAHVPPERRPMWLAEQCGTDEALRRQIEQMLARVDHEVSSADAAIARLTREGADVLLAPGAVVGDFTIVGPLGSGATGVVYLARQHHPNRTVAMKTLRGGLEASSARRRFEVEAEVLAQLQHPGIAQIYASHPGDDRTPPYIAMELVDGRSLTEYAEARDLSRVERIDLVARVCDAVQHAHQRGIIHRDLKPPNILVSPEGQPKVLDFGVARAEGAHLSLTTANTGPGQLVGTLPYMSPEQIQSSPDGTDTRTDVYSLGVILFRLLVGRLPFAEDDPPLHELGRRIAFDSPPRLSAIDPTLRGDLETIVARALAKERDRRYTSPAALASDLRRFISGLPIAASADSAWYVLRKQVSRYRRALLGSAAVAVVLVGLATYASFQRSRADRINAQLEDQLAMSNIERGRLAALNGHLPVAEGIVWRELFRQPDSLHARWTLWDLYSREPSLWARRLHEGGTQTVRFAPDGRTLLTGGRLDGVIRVVDAGSGHVAAMLSAAGGAGVLRAFFSPDAATIVAGSVDGTLRVWNVETRQVHLEISRAVQGLRDMALVADGAHAVTIGSSPGVQVWSLNTGTVVTTLGPEVHDLRSVATGRSEDLVLAGAANGTLAAWDLSDRKLLWLTTSTGPAVTSMAVEPISGRVASGSADGLVHLWDGRTGKPVRSLRYDTSPARNLAFDVGGKTLAATGFWRTRLWDLSVPDDTPHDIGASEGMTDLHLRFDGGALATCDGGSGQVRLWDLAADLGTDRWSGHASPVVGLAVSADAESLITAAIDGVSTWSIGAASGARSFVAGVRLNMLANSRSRQWIATAGNPTSTAVWNSRDGRRVSSTAAGVSGRVAAFSDDDRRVYLGNADGTITVWDWVDEGAPIRRWLSQDGQVQAMVVSGQRVFVARGNTAISVLNAETGVEIHRLAMAANPYSVAVSPDGRVVAAGTTRGVIPVWDVNTGRKLYELKGQTRRIHAIDFSPDGRLVVSASRDGSTRLWDVATGNSLATVASRDVGAQCVRFFPDGRRIGIGYENGEVEVRDLHYFFRHVAGHAEYQLQLLSSAGEFFPRSPEVLAWSRQLLSTTSSDRTSRTR